MRMVVIVHRWIGVPLCLLFALWFASGIVMIYVPFPALSAAERLARAAPLDASRIAVPLVRLLDEARIERVERVRLMSRGERPIVVMEGDGRVASAYADNGASAAPLTAEEARTVAELFAGTPALTVAGPLDFDQWVVHQGFDSGRPFYRVAIDDAAGTSIYVAAASGEVWQRTTRAQRAWNYAGAVVHWIYPTVIRKHWALWDALVWWLSLAGIVAALLGVTLGIVRLRDAWRRGRRGITSPFVGWLRWHHVLGLVLGVFVTTWIVSGWLSMDHARLFSTPDPTAEQLRRFRGMSVRAAAAAIPVEALQPLAGVRELTLTSLAGRPIVIADYAGRRQLFEADAANQLLEFRVTDAVVLAAVNAAWPGLEVERMIDVAAGDVYAHLREGSLGDNVARVVLADDAGTWVHVDRDSGAIVSVMDRSRRFYRWLFNGLHSFDVPGFVSRRPLWDATMISLLLAGFVFSVTCVVIAYRRVIATACR